MSNQGGGVSQSYVDNAIARAVRPLERDIGILDQRLRQLENEMANVEGAVREMHRGLGNELHELKKGNAELIDVQKATKKLTLEQFVETNKNLGTANLQLGVANTSLVSIHDTSATGFRTLDAGIDRMAQALVQTEVIRLLKEAKEPNDRVLTFAEEIEQRFAKTLESVYVVREQYDQLIGVATNEYENKLRVIGEHIFQMYEEDFRQWAEAPLSEASGRVVEMPIELDSVRLEHRRAALEARFDTLGDDVIEPLLTAHRSLEHTLASKFSVQVEGHGEEVALPVSLRVWSSGKVDVLGTVKVTRDEHEGLKVSPAGDPSIQEAAMKRVEPVASQLKTTTMGPNELAQLKQTLERLANEGRIDASLLPGYLEYLDQFGLDTVAMQEVEAP